MDFEDDDELPPLPRMPSPNSPKRLRRRPHFGAPSAIVSSAVVPSPAPDQVISTLIDSLTAISQSARDDLGQHFAVEPPLSDIPSEYERPQSSDSFYADIPSWRPSNGLSHGEDAISDEDVAAAPVIRLARAPPALKTREAKRNGMSPYLSAGISDRPVSVRSSITSLRSQDAHHQMGMPSIERANGSSTSLTHSVRSVGSRNVHKAVTLEPRRSDSPLRSTSRTSSFDANGVDGSPPRSSFEEEKENNNPDATPIKYILDNVENDVQSPNGDSHRLSALSPMNRGSLQNHLIPNRRSSVRRNNPSDDRRRSLGSRDLKDMNIDVDLIGSDDSTVRRIKELQEAREKRQSEWRKEARRSTERSAKRHSAPSPKSSPRSKQYQSPKLEVTEVLVESEHEAAPSLSATVNSDDLRDMQAWGTIISDDPPLTPQEPIAQKRPQPVLSPSKRSTSRASRPNSMQFKRTSAYSNRDDAKSISEDVEAFVNAPRLTQKLKHPRTGRTIAFSEVGDPKGFAVFCCVGMGLTRYVTAFYDDLARTLKLRLITPDRPGVGESEPLAERLYNPLTWVDDIAVICQHLEISRYSLLAHSAGAIYAMATALKMPQYVRGRIHLLSPWIPPSQMPKGAALGPESQPITNLPMAHRVLSVLPSPFLKIANTRFLSAASAGIDIKPAKSKKTKNLEALDGEFSNSYPDLTEAPLHSLLNGPDESLLDGPRSVSCYQANNDTLVSRGVINKPTSPEPRNSSQAPRRTASPALASPTLSPEARASMYNSTLTHRIWSLATLNSNPAIDLMTCLERKKTIGYRYAEVTRSVVIRHGAKDTRVPLDNVRWLQTIMKRCELRVLDNEGHNLMGNATVMADLLAEIAKEWEEWEVIAKDKAKKKREISVSGTTSRSLKSWGSLSVRS